MVTLTRRTSAACGVALVLAALTTACGSDEEQSPATGSALADKVAGIMKREYSFGYPGSRGFAKTSCALHPPRCNVQYEGSVHNYNSGTEQDRVVSDNQSLLASLFDETPVGRIRMVARYNKREFVAETCTREQFHRLNPDMTARQAAKVCRVRVHLDPNLAEPID